MSEKTNWTIHQNRDDTISIYRDGEFILAMDDRIENHRLILRFQRDLDRLAEVNKVLVEALDEAKWFCQDQLARANQAIDTDCPKCDYQCQGCIQSIDDCEALKNKITGAIAKAKEMGK